MSSHHFGRFKKYDEQQKKKVSFDQLDKLVREQVDGGPDKQITKLPEPEGWRFTDSILIKCPGYWWLHSNSDDRWRAQGKSNEVGGTDMCPEAKRAFYELQQKLGKKVPFDFIYRFEPRDVRKFKLASDPDQMFKNGKNGLIF